MTAELPRYSQQSAAARNFPTDRKSVRRLCAAAIAALLIVGCGGEGDGSQEDGPNPPPPPPPPAPTSELSIGILGQGAVATSDESFSCDEPCVHDIEQGETVTLNANPDTGFEFGFWGGDCEGTVSTCTLLIDSNKVAVASFRERAVVNQPPVAEVSGDTNGTILQALSLSGAQSSDPENASLTYSWSVLSSVTGSNPILTAPDSVATSFVADLPGIYVISLTVNDGENDSEPALHTVGLSGVGNTMPVAVITGASVGTVSTPMTLSGELSNDPDNDPLRFGWSILSAPANSNAVLSTPDKSTTSFETDTPGTYVISLTVNDGQLDSIPFTHTIEVMSAQNSPPTARITGGSSIDPDSLLQLSGAQSSDPEDDPLTYSWTIASAPAGSNSVLATPGQIATTFQSDTAGTYVIRLVVNDGQQDSVPVTHTIEVTNAQNLPPTARITGGSSIDANSLLQLSGAQSSDPESDPLSYTWTIASAPAGSNPELATPDQVATTFRSDTAGTHVISLVVNDGQQDSLVDTHVVTVTDGSPPDPDVVARMTVSKLDDASSNETVTFGSVFAEGAVSGTDSLEGFIDGQAIPVQLDAKALHDDGSVRHGIVTAVVPNLPFGVERPLELRAASAPANGNPMSVDDLPPAFDAVVTITEGGNSYSASARDLLASQAPRTWLSGPLAGEWHVWSDLLHTGTGQPHSNLSAHLYVRATAGGNNIRVDVIVENNWATSATPRNVVYNLNISVGGDVVLSESNVTHYRQARFRRTFWWGDAPAYYVAHNLEDLIDLGVVENYDPVVEVTENDLAALYNDWNFGTASNGHGSREIMGLGLTYDQMPAAADRPDIGPLPRWQLQYLLTMDPRAKEASLGTGDQAGSFPMHYRDRATGLPYSIVDHPQAHVGSMPDCQQNCNVPYVPDTAHLPSLNFIPYVVTGDYYHLEEMLFWGSYIHLYRAPQDRGDDLGLMYTFQVRGQAWSLRELLHIDWILTADHPQKTYYAGILQNNIDYYTQRYVGLNGQPPTATNPLGVITETLWLADDRQYTSWMNDFFTWSVGHGVTLGYENMRPLLGFLATNVIERMTNPDYCYVFAAIKFINFRPSGSSPAYDDWATIYRDTVSEPYRSMECGGQEMADALGIVPGQLLPWRSTYPQGFPLYMQIALSTVAETDAPNAALAWDNWENQVNPRDPSQSPEWSILPRSIPAPPDGGLEGNLLRIQTMPSNSWIRIDNNLPSDIIDWEGNLNGAEHQMWHAWQRGAYLPDNRTYYKHGGGHATNLSAAVIGFDLETGLWSEHAAWNSRPGDTTGHTYDAWIPIPGTNQLLMGYSGANDGPQPWTWMFHADTREWEQLGDLMVNGSPAAGLALWSASALHHPPSGKTLILSRNYLWEFNDTTRQWTETASVPTTGFSSKTVVFDTQRNIIWNHSWQRGGTPPGVQQPRLDKFVMNTNGTIQFYEYDVPVTGDTEILEWEGVGADYDPVKDKVVMYAEGQDVYEFDPGTLVITKVTPGGVNPGNVQYNYVQGMNSSATAPHPDAHHHGHYGGFEYIDEFGVFIISMGRDSGVYVYKP